jgi:hypothetical protein
MYPLANSEFDAWEPSKVNGLKALNGANGFGAFFLVVVVWNDAEHGASRPKSLFWPGEES